MCCLDCKKNTTPPVNRLDGYVALVNTGKHQVFISGKKEKLYRADACNAGLLTNTATVLLVKVSTKISGFCTEARFHVRKSQLKHLNLI